MARDLSHIGNVLCDLGKLDAAATAFREARVVRGRVRASPNPKPQPQP